MLVIVIPIGVGTSEMRSWASLDNKGKPMYFPLASFVQFVQLAHYIHKGEFLKRCRFTSLVTLIVYIRIKTLNSLSTKLLLTIRIQFYKLFRSPITVCICKD